MTTHRTKEGTEAKAHILVVDDEEFIRSSFQLYFETLGYRTSAAEGGEAALEIVRRHKPDVVLLDLVMPGMHGIEVLRAIKEIDGTAQVIIATGCGSMNTAIQALRYGAYDYVTKPIVNFDDDLRKVVEEALSERRDACGLTARKTEPGSPDEHASGLLLSLEKVAVLASSDVPRSERFREVASALGLMYGASAVVLWCRDSLGSVGRLEVWTGPGSAVVRRVDSLAPPDPAGADIRWKQAGGAEDAAPRMESLALSLGNDAGAREPREGTLVIVRRTGIGRPEVHAPNLVSLSAARALGFEGASRGVGQPSRGSAAHSVATGSRVASA